MFLAFQQTTVRFDKWDTICRVLCAIYLEIPFMRFILCVNLVFSAVKTVLTTQKFIYTPSHILSPHCNMQTHQPEAHVFERKSSTFACNNRLHSPAELSLYMRHSNCLQAASNEAKFVQEFLKFTLFKLLGLRYLGAQVRILFATAAEYQPAIIFIGECLTNLDSYKVLVQISMSWWLDGQIDPAYSVQDCPSLQTTVLNRDYEDDVSFRRVIQAVTNSLQ